MTKVKLVSQEGELAEVIPLFENPRSSQLG